MLKKLLLSGLFAIVTFGFFLGFVSYQSGIREALSKSVDTSIMEEENIPSEEEPLKKELLVPKIIGLRENEAEKLLKDAGLLPSSLTEHTDQVEKGYVFYQKPIEGAKILEGEEVIYTVSAGPFGQEEPDEVDVEKEVLLPSLLGKSQREGEALLKELGLKVRVRRDYSNDSIAGTIMEQVPIQNTKMNPEDEVTLWVSLGAKPEETKPEATKHTVPRVVGMTRTEAEGVLKNAGYGVTVTEKEDADGNVGKVLSQSPAGGTEVSVKGRVQIIIGKKKTEVTETPSERPGEEESYPSDGLAPPAEEPEEPEEPEEIVETGNN